MKLTNILAVVLLSAVTTFAVSTYVVAPTETKKETAFERVMRTGTLRCGYVLYPTFVEKDLNTGKMQGLYPTLMDEIGHRLNLKIEWAEEVGLANMFEGLKSGRYDVLCNPLNPTPGRARAAEFTHPVLYAPLFAYVRADDTRFDNNLKAINDPSVRLAYLEGELSQSIKEEDYPNAASVSLPNLTDLSQVMLQISSGKADVSMTEPSSADIFIASNPGKIKRVAGPPARMMSGGLNVASGEGALKALLNTTIETLHSTGYIERLLIKKPEDKELYFLPTHPWRRAGD